MHDGLQGRDSLHFRIAPVTGKGRSGFRQRFIKTGICLATGNKFIDDFANSSKGKTDISPRQHNPCERASLRRMHCRRVVFFPADKFCSEKEKRLCPTTFRLSTKRKTTVSDYISPKQVGDETIEFVLRSSAVSLSSRLGCLNIREPR